MAFDHVKYMKYDGLNRMISHKIHKVIKEPLFTRIIVNLSGPATKENATVFFKQKTEEFDNLIQRSYKRAPIQKRAFKYKPPHNKYMSYRKKTT